MSATARIAAITFGLIAILFAARAADAARGVDAELTGERIEIVVFESPTSIYCRLFRRDVLPRYQSSRRAKSAPIRFVDIADADLQPDGFSGPVSIVPTAVVLRDGQEIGRIAGYTGPDNFQQSIAALLGPLD